MSRIHDRWRWFWLIPLLGYTCLVMMQLLPSQRPCITARKAGKHLSAHDATMPASTNSSATDVDAESRSDAPQVEALFLIKFDKKVGWVGRAPSWRTRC
jgi:hypothetical protein